MRESIVTVGLHDRKGSMIFGGGLRKLNAKLPPTVSTFSAVSTDRFPAFYKSLGVVTYEGCPKTSISLMCIIAGIMTISCDAEKYFYYDSLYNTSHLEPIKLTSVQVFFKRS